MNPLYTFALVGAFLGVASSQQYCTEPVRKACKSDIGASACITTQCSTTIGTGDDDFKNTMIEEHNKIRAETAFGKYGANMLEMKWNSELEDNALRWLQNLCDKNNMFHDDNNCRQTPSFNSVGQNLYTSTANYTNISVAGKEAIDAWHSEKNLTSLSELIPYTFNSATGHYTQVIWADSYLLGCAYLSKMSESSGNKAWVACNYAKGGNVIGKNAFQASDWLGSNCTDGSGRGSSGLCKVCRAAKVNTAIDLTPTK